MVYYKVEYRGSILSVDLVSITKGVDNGKIAKRLGEKTEEGVVGVYNEKPFIYISLDMIKEYSKDYDEIDALSVIVKKIKIHIALTQHTDK